MRSLTKPARLWMPCLVVGVLVACGVEDAPAPAAEGVAGGFAWRRPAADLLSKEHAEIRARQVSEVAYELNLDLVESTESYVGKVRIEFSLASKDHPLTLDFSGGTVDAMLVNGAIVEADYNGFFITLQPDALMKGHNSVEIDYRHAYSSDGNGLYRFVDAEDGETYIYSYLWPYYANRLFPCFDQPDLRASFGLVVRVPANWVVASASKESTVLEFSDDSGDQKLWRFPTTARFSTYVFSLYAGPYRVWKTMAGAVPLRLMARQSMAPYVNAAAWFELTRRGLSFYEQYFGIPYPFGKYDQIIVPDFNISGMENVAAVSYTESVLSRGVPTHQQKERLALLILHEMAHMWFGDLVTMKWWNGLWLNESFATYMSYVAAAEASEFNDAWHRFFLFSKRSAYRADQLVTTHPIEMPVPDTGSFFTVFDAITYGKGASVLKQLVHALGKEQFKRGVSQYLKKHSYSNTTLADFTASLAQAAGRDISQWVDDWLYQAGVNTVAVWYHCDDGKLEQLSVYQAAPVELPTLREHRLELGLYFPDADKRLRSLERLPVSVANTHTVVTAARGKPCPTLVYPNLDDWGYARIRLDAKALVLGAAHVVDLQNPLHRSMWWHDLWEATRDGQLSLAGFADIALENVSQETNDKVVDQVLGVLTETLAYLNRLGPVSARTLEAYLPRIEDFLWSNVLSVPPGSDLQKTWLDRYVGLSQTPKALKRLVSLLDGSLALEDLDIDQDRRWDMIVRLNAMAHPGADEMIEAELGRDASALGAKRAIAAEATRPDMEIKQAWLKEFLNPKSEFSFSEQRAAMRAMFPNHQSAIHAELHAAILDALPTISSGRDDYFSRSYTRELLPPLCRTESVARLAAALAASDKLNPTVTKFLREAHQEDQRCLKLAQDF